MALGGPAGVSVAAGVGIAQPYLGHEIRGLGLKSLEIAIQGKQDEDVLLGARPTPPGPVGQQPIDHLGDQVALRVTGDQCVQNDGVSPPVRM